MVAPVAPHAPRADASRDACRELPPVSFLVAYGPIWGDLGRERAPAFSRDELS
jgi:hypothetical protein